MKSFLDEEDRQVLATVAIWLVAVVVGAVSVALALGLALRLFVWVGGL